MIEKIYLLLFLVTFLQINAMNIFVSDKKATNELVHRKNAKTTPPKTILMTRKLRKNLFPITRTPEEENKHNKKVYDSGYICGCQDGCCFGTLLGTAASGLVFTAFQFLIWQSESQ